MQTLPTEFFLILAGRDEAERLIVRAGLASATGALPADLGLPTFWRLCAENIRLKDDETHGVAAERVPRGSLPLLFISAKEADTLAEALERLTAVAPLIRKECSITLGRSRAALHLTLRPVILDDVRAEVYVECFALVLHCALRWMTGRRLAPVHVRGAARIADMGEGLLPALDAPMTRKGSGVTITYGRNDTSAPILARKYKAWGEEEFESFLALLNEQEERVSTHDRLSPTCDAVSLLLHSGLYSQEAVSSAMRLSVPTLRRRLKAEGSSFRRLSAGVRGAQLQHLLATDVRLEDIADRLGLSDVRSLRRVCQSTLGLSSRDYRRGLSSVSRHECRVPEDEPTSTTGADRPFDRLGLLKTIRR